MWAFVAYFGPQFVLIPLLPLLQIFKLDSNVKLFVVQALLQILTLAVLFLVIRRYGLAWPSIGLERFKLPYAWLAIVAFPIYLLAAVIIANVVAYVYPVNLQQIQDIGFHAIRGPEIALVFIALVIITPLTEEIIFRGFLFRAYRQDFGFWIGTLLVSLIFAVAHGQLNVGLDVFALSILLCYVREKTGSLWPAIMLHALKNLVAFVILFIINPK